MNNETELEMVGRHVREGAAILLRQAALVAEMRATARDTATAQALLKQFEAIQGEHLAHLARLTGRDTTPDGRSN